MPILYGEGEPKAFLRLQQEIGKHSDDESLFAWNDSTMTFTGIFAQSPSAFINSSSIQKCSSQLANRKPWFLTNKGLAIDLPIRLDRPEDFESNMAPQTMSAALFASDSLN